MQFRLSVSLIILVSFGFAEAAISRYSYSQRNTNNCSMPDFPNGQIKLKLRGKALQFECNEGFTLIGLSYMFCKEGRLDSKTPKCVKPCDELPAVPNGFIFYEKHRTIATLYCNVDYEVDGSSFSNCNGTHWDPAIGNCRRLGLAEQTSCDFEDEDLCGWISAASHEYHWKRSAGFVSGSKLGNPSNGHFLMVHSFEHISNLTTRLISPIYTANYSQNACFQFYYHMHGDLVGTLSVYIKPLSKLWCEVIAEGAEFSVSGSQSNAWNQGFFDLSEQNEDFRIVVEASLGIESILAIDDVSLLSGSDCYGVTTTDVTSTLSHN